MADHVFKDVLRLAKRGAWPRERTLPLLEQAAETAEQISRIPANHGSRTQRVPQLANATAGVVEVEDDNGDGDGDNEADPSQGHANGHAVAVNLAAKQRLQEAGNLRALFVEIKDLDCWPPPRGIALGRAA